MFNKTDAANSSDIENRKSMLPSQKVKDSVVKLPDLPNNDQTETISPLNRIVLNA